MDASLRSIHLDAHRTHVRLLAAIPRVHSGPLPAGAGRRHRHDGSGRRGDDAFPSPPVSGGGGRGGAHGCIRRVPPVPCLDAEERRIQAERALPRPFSGRRAGANGVYLSTPNTDKCFEDSEGGCVRYGLASMQAWRATTEDAGPHSDFEGPICGSTVCVAIIRNDQLVVANAGDSRCVVSRKCKAHDLSRDQKPDLGTERERIKDADSFVVAGRVNGSLNLSRAIGDMELKTNERLPVDRQIVSAEPEVNTVQLSDDNEFIVLACDGIWNCMSSQEVEDCVQEKLITGPHSDFEGPTCVSIACGFVVAGQVNGSLNLSRAIGDMELKTNERLPADRQIVSAEPEVNTVQLSDIDEFIVLACDGIWDCISSQEVVDFVHEKLRTDDSPSAVCEKMLDRCLAPEAGGDGCDNMTVIVVQFKKPTNEPDDRTTPLK